MAKRNNGKVLAGLLIALLMGAVLASATIVPPERVAPVLHPKAAADVTEDCKAAPRTAAKSPAAQRDTQAAKKSTEAGHPHPDPIRHLLRGILL
jgi:hypothetical protein